MASGLWTYNSRWDAPTVNRPVPPGLVSGRGAQLLYEQVLVGGQGNALDSLTRYNDSDLGVLIPNGIKRLAMAIRVNSLAGGAVGDIMMLGIELKPQLANRFYTVKSPATSRYTGGGVFSPNCIEVMNFDGKLTTGGAAYAGFLGAADPSTEASNMTANRNESGFPIFAASHVRTGWAFTHGAGAGGTFNFTVQMWGIYGDAL